MAFVDFNSLLTTDPKFQAGAHGERKRLARRTAFEADDVEASCVQQLCGERTDFAETEDGDPAKRHGGLPQNSNRMPCASGSA